MMNLLKNHNEHSLAIKVLGNPIDFYKLKKALLDKLFPIKFEHIETSSTLHVIQLSLKHQRDKDFILSNQPWRAGNQV
ncbi:hypothetical protein MKX03_012637, partial [Papaver bracteatum]